MGACYSKGSASAKHLKGKPPKSKKHPASRHREESAGLIQSEDADKKLNATSLEVEETSTSETQDSFAIPTSAAFPDLVSGLEMQNGDTSLADKGVAPSDSGIESLGLVTQEELFLNEEAPSLSTRIERLSRGSCHKCGNFRLEDNALTALLADTYCLCGPRQAGRPTVNPDCQTHGVKKNFKRSISMPVKCSLDNSPKRSNLKKYDSERVEKNLRVSLNDHLDQVETFDCANSEDVQAPLAQFDSYDTVLNESAVSQKRLSRRSLLSEILDITDSICKCDFYSNEFCSVQENSNSGYVSKGAVREEGKSNSGGGGGDNLNDTLDSLVLSGSSCSILEVSCENNLTSAELPTSKCVSTSLSKFVTFAKAGEITTSDQDRVVKDSGCQSCPISPVKRASTNNAVSIHNSFSESSGVDMHSADLSGSMLTSQMKECLSRSRELLMSAASYEAVDVVTEDDLASVDMDSLSRVTSLSYCSIRQLLESTEDLVEPLSTVRRMTIGGEDCVIIPTQTYRQMQSDLSMLKEQLVCLSSLLQEDSVDSRSRKSLSFCSDQDLTFTQRRLGFRSQEFVDSLPDDQ